MINSNLWADSPRAEGESLREDNSVSGDSRETGRSNSKARSARTGGCTRGEVIPQENVFFAGLGVKLLDDCSDFPGILTTEHYAIRRFIYDREAEISRFLGNCVENGCTYCLDRVTAYRSKLVQFIENQGDWIQHRLGLERRVIRKARAMREQLKQQGISHHRLGLFERRIHLVRTLELIQDRKSIVTLITTVSDISWRDLWGS